MHVVTSAWNLNWPVDRKLLIWNVGGAWTSLIKMKILFYWWKQYKSCNESLLCKLPRSRVIIIRAHQVMEFNDIIKELNKRGFSSKPPYAKLRPFLDEDGILRVKTRLNKATAAYDFTSQILLPTFKIPINWEKTEELANDWGITQKILKEAHEKTIHGGEYQMFTYIRSSYYALNLRRSIRWYIRNCINCEITKGKKNPTNGPNKSRGLTANTTFLPHLGRLFRAILYPRRYKTKSPHQDRQSKGTTQQNKSR